MPNGRILIVDDSSTDFELCQMNLATSGYPEMEITHADTAAHGLQLAHQLKPDCILLDYMLPDMTGIDFLRRYSENDASAAVVMMSGEGSEQVVVTAMKLCADDYFPKNDLHMYDLGEVVHNAIIRKALDRIGQHGYRDLLAFSNAVCDSIVGPLQEAAAAAERLRNGGRGSGRSGRATDIQALDRAISLALRTSEQLRHLDCGDKPEFLHGIKEWDLNEVLEDALASQRWRIEAVDATVRAQTLPTEFVNGGSMTILLGNLIANATACGASGSGAGLEIDITVEDHDGFWKIGVSDNGPGMVPADRTSAFTPFAVGSAGSTGRDGGVRAGLGLTVSRSIVERHGGSIWVDPGLNDGTRVYFTLPKRSSI